MKNQKGFAQVFLLSALPFVLGALLLLCFWLSFIRLEMRLRYEARRTQISAQNQSRRLLDELLRKNADARRLKMEYLVAKAALAVAVASENPAAIVKAKAHLDKVQFRRQTLDIAQKILIRAADLNLRLQSEHLYGNLVRLGAGQSRFLQAAFRIDLLAERPISPRLAVEPTSSDIAPVYRTRDGFSRRQAMVQKWKYRIRVAKPLQAFLQSEAAFQSVSRITLAGKVGEWRIESRPDRY